MLGEGLVLEFSIVFKEKAMATHSSTLAWGIPWMEEPGRLQSTGSQRVGHNSVTTHSRTWKLKNDLNELI